LLIGKERVVKMGKKVKHDDVSCKATKKTFELVAKRIEKERKPTEYVLYKKNVPVKLRRGAFGNILSYNDSYLYYSLDMYMNCYGTWAYSNLSKGIHKYGYNTLRGKIEKELDELIPSEEFTFLKVRGIVEFGVVGYFNSKKLPLPKKWKQNRIINLCNQFGQASRDYHYKLTKQQKSLIRRLNRKTKSVY
jgi:hypothetical protein